MRLFRCIVAILLIAYALTIALTLLDFLAPIEENPVIKYLEIGICFLAIGLGGYMFYRNVR
jgi:ABC-type nickel/cobalt efflux system permease component RcnA